MLFRSVEIDAARARRAVGMMKGDAALEDVGVIHIVWPGGIRLGNAEQIAKLREEEGVVRALGSARVRSAGNERSDVGSRFHAEGCSRACSWRKEGRRGSVKAARWHISSKGANANEILVPLLG